MTTQEQNIKAAQPVPRGTLSFFDRAKNIIPGGVHSPVRSFKNLDRDPVCFEKAKGAHLIDTDGKSYIDFCMSFGPLILGHAHPVVTEKLIEQTMRGTSFGAFEPYSLELCEYIIDQLPPFFEHPQLRLVNSGTEAVMTALRLARGYTGKDKILKFNGCYHGHSDALLIKAGSGVQGISETSSLGVPHKVAEDTLVLELDDDLALEQTLNKHANELACVIIEPLPANCGLLPQRVEYLKKLRALCSQHQILLIFDEVISGFRMGFGGMSELLQITPDIVTWGKIIGGGLPVGALCASAEIMGQLAPLGNVYQAGTLSANPLAVTAGLATMKTLKENPNTYSELEAHTKKVVSMLNQWLLKNADSDPQLNSLKFISFGSLFWAAPKAFDHSTMRTPAGIEQTHADAFYPLFHRLLKSGIYLSPNSYEVGFLSTAHDEKVLSELAAKLERA